LQQDEAGVSNAAAAHIRVGSVASFPLMERVCFAPETGLSLRTLVATRWARSRHSSHHNRIRSSRLIRPATYASTASAALSGACGSVDLARAGEPALLLGRERFHGGPRGRLALLEFSRWRSAALSGAVTALSRDLRRGGEDEQRGESDPGRGTHSVLLVSCGPGHRIIGGLAHQNAYAPHPFALLRPRRQRPRRRRAAEQGYELASYPLTECIRSLSGQDCKHDIQSVKVSQEASERIYNRPATPRSGPGLGRVKTHSRRGRLLPVVGRLPQCLESGRKVRASASVAMCHKPT
jgi:hypothetical protein